MFIVATVSSLAFAGAVQWWEALKISPEEGQKTLTASLWGGGFVSQERNNILKNARELSTEERADVTRQLMQFAKEYTQTEEFKDSYKALRKEKMNRGTKSAAGLPKLNKIINNAIDQKMDAVFKEEEVPKNPDDMVRKRLQEFLNTSESVDFAATLDANRRFTNPEYERKPREWKMCYRAGKEVIAVAREEAKKWLEELNNR